MITIALCTSNIDDEHELKKQESNLDIFVKKCNIMSLSEISRIFDDIHIPLKKMTYLDKHWNTNVRFKGCGCYRNGSYDYKEQIIILLKSKGGKLLRLADFYSGKLNKLSFVLSTKIRSILSKSQLNHLEQNIITAYESYIEYKIRTMIKLLNELNQHMEFVNKHCVDHFKGIHWCYNQYYEDIKDFCEYCDTSIKEYRMSNQLMNADSFLRRNFSCEYSEWIKVDENIISTINFALSENIEKLRIIVNSNLFVNICKFTMNSFLEFNCIFSNMFICNTSKVECKESFDAKIDDQEIKDWSIKLNELLINQNCLINNTELLGDI